MSGRGFARRLFGTLERKLAIWLLGLLLASGLVVIAVHVQVTRLHFEEVEQRLHRDLAEHLVKEGVLMIDGRVSPDDLEHVFHLLMVVNPRIECYLLDREGRILAYSAPPDRVKLERVDTEPITQLLGGARLPLRGDDPRHPGARKIFSAATIPARDGDTSSPDAIDGYLYVVLAGEALASARQALFGGWISRLGTGTLLASVLAAALLGMLALRLLTRRLRRLRRSLAEFEASDFERPPGVPAPTALPDDLDELETGFFEMAQHIAQQMRELERTDRLRRELVANVSHDLRTPVASIQGYVETLLLKHDTLPPDERKRYLEIAHSQGERLGRLIEELFELATLDSGDAVLNHETLRCAELAQDVALEFRLRAEQAGVELEQTLDPEAPPVSADVRLLGRALENLLENALRHTPAKGRIALSVMRNGSSVIVAVEDTGSGIPANELPHIFDRLYSGSKRRRDPMGRATGLGLAIAQRIVALHGSRLEVESAEGEGSRFSFHLHAADSAA